MIPAQQGHHFTDAEAKDVVVPMGSAGNGMDEFQHGSADLSKRREENPGLAETEVEQITRRLSSSSPE